MAEKKQAVEVEKKDYLAEKDIWVNADYSKVVEADSPEAGHIVAFAGQAIVHESAITLGLIKPVSGKASESPAGSAGGTGTK
jgi:hypothetical protein